MRLDLHVYLITLHVCTLAFSFVSWWLSCPGGLIKAEFESNMLCMLYMPCLHSHCLGLNSILRILTSILHSSATRDPVAQW